MHNKYKITLHQDEWRALQKLTCTGKVSARKIKRAQILLMSNQYTHSDAQISQSLSVSLSTIYRTKRDFVEYGLETALEEGARSGQPRKLDANQEALLVSIACSNPPLGRSRWTLSLLNERFIALTDLEQISIETIRARLKENDLKPWQKKMWCIAKMDAAYIAQMEHILDLYAEPADEKRPLINFDEAMKQLVKQINTPKMARPGTPCKEDYEYQRAGMANIFMHFDRHRGWRKAKVTDTKTAIDFAHCMRELADEEYPEADIIRVVLDNLSTHTPASLYKAFPPQEARRLLRRLEFHYTPKHASWLNMVEIEIGNMNQQCLDRRIADKETLLEELAHWQNQRNKQKASITWMFDVDKARKKLHRAYDALNQSELS